MNAATAVETLARTLFEKQKAHAPQLGLTDARARRARLDALLEALMKYRKRFHESLHADFGKHPTEVDLVELYPVAREIRHVRRRLQRWLAPQRVPTPLPLLGTRSWIRYEPKGVTLILSPWNFPINLTFTPLISAIAGGNTAVLKPSEYTPHTAGVMAELIGEVFDEREVALLQGGPEVAQMLLELPFNHIFFTGSPRVGKLVMASAARHLASVTLELGGKSPTIVDDTADIGAAARRIALGKYVNDGQICIAPDYLLVHEHVHDRLIEAIRQQLVRYYTEQPKRSPALCRIVNDGHFQRLRELLDDAAAKGAHIISMGTPDPAQRYMPPTLLTQVTDGMRVMQEEIFGPLLPVLRFGHLEEATAYVNKGEKPLALYVFSRKPKHIRYVLARTRAGGTAINAVGIHFYNNHLPFGGVNFSGLGKSHGWHGFQEFTNPRGVTAQQLPGIAELLAPPYNTLKQKLVAWALKWL